MSVKLITIDGSTVKTGIAVFQDGIYETHFLLDYSKNKDMESRFLLMSKKIWNVLEEQKPDILYIEETYMANNAQTMKILTRLQGVVYSWCMNNDCEFNTIKPTQWRKLLNFEQGKATKRKDLKQQSIQYVLKKYGLEVFDDEADSICIGDAVIRNFL